MYKLNIENFEGPLDLLLQLIQKNKLNICEISISKIADDFIEHVSKTRFEDVDMLSDFIYISSKLVEIKSKYMLCLQDEEENIDENELVTSLKEYSKYKELTKDIKDMYEMPYLHYERLSQEIYTVTELDFSSLTLENIKKMVLENIENEDRQVHFTKKQKSLTEKINYISKYLDKKNKCYFEDILQENKKDEKVISILGVLQMAKEHTLNVNQNKNFSQIAIEKGGI